MPKMTCASCGAEMRLESPPSTHVTMTITGMPGLMADMQREMARMLRRVAADEAVTVAARLREIATAFECGQAPGDLADGEG